MQLKNPNWLNEIIQCSGYSVNDRIDQINTRLKTLLVKQKPFVSIIIPVKDEEKNILNCLDSLSRNICDSPVELVIVNNNSTDGTENILSKLHIINCDQPKQGIGWARQLGLETASGKYILTADADCIYHTQWINAMLYQLQQDDVVCVSGRYSFIGDKVNKRWKLQVYEFLRNIVINVRNKKHPYLNARGGCMGYVKSIAVGIGYDTRNVRGEDGRLFYDLMLKGKFKFINSLETNVWTYIKSQHTSGSKPSIGILYNLNKEFWRSLSYFRQRKNHDTKFSDNTPDSFKSFMKSWRKNKN